MTAAMISVANPWRTKCIVPTTKTLMIVFPQGLGSYDWLAVEEIVCIAYFPPGGKGNAYQTL